MPVSLARTVQRFGLRAGAPLPDVYDTLVDAKIRFRRSGLHMISGTPGSMKTALALNLARKMRVPTLYFSNDSDELTVCSRLMAHELSITTEEAERRLQVSSEASAQAFASVEHIRWCFNPSPSLVDIEEEIKAFEEMYGENPWLVVVDILMQVDYAEDSEHGSLMRIMQYLKGLSGQSEACFLILHHTSEQVRGRPCQPRAAILQKVNQLPVLQLNVAFDGGNEFYIAPVKNRFGPADASGRNCLVFQVDPSQCRISDKEKPKPRGWYDNEQ